MDHPVARPPATGLCEACGVEPKRSPRAQWCHGCHREHVRRYHRAWQRQRHGHLPRPDGERTCRDCGVSITQLHRNAQRCTACREQRTRRPRSTLTASQGAQVARWIGRLSRREIAQRLGVSLAAVARYTRDQGLYGRSDAYPAEVVEAVLRVYEQAPPGLGWLEVQRCFPQVRHRSITERYRDFAPRQRRWTGEEMIEAARMAGLVSHTAQARYFARPHAAAGSIKSLWMKGFQCAPGAVNGLPTSLAFGVAQAGCLAVLVQMAERSGPRTMCLWLDLVPHLRPDVEPWVREAVEALAAFQRWLHGTSSSADIRRMIALREGQYGDADTGADERPRRHTTAAGGEPV